MRTKKNETIVKVILTAVTLIMGLCCIYPFIFMISSSFKPSGDVLSTPLQIIPKNFTLTNFETLFHNEFYDFFKWFGNAWANVETRGESVFAARNAIDKELLAQKGIYQEFIKIREQAEGWRIQQ